VAVAVAACGLHNLALHRDGHVTVWGAEYHRPKPPDGLIDVIDIAASSGRCMALHGDGHVTLWNWNVFGRWHVWAAEAVAIAGGDQSNSLALHRDGHITAWGGVSEPIDRGIDNAGEPIDRGIDNAGEPVDRGIDNASEMNGADEVGDAVAMAAGALFNLALHRDGHVTAWASYGDRGRLRVPPWLTDVTAVAAGGRHGVAIIAA
jgi:hypothetical protein